MEKQSNSCLPKQESNEELDAEEPPRGAGGDLPAAGSASRRQSEASQEEPPRKRAAVPGTSPGKESGRSAVAERAIPTADVGATATAAKMCPRRQRALHSAARRGDATAVRELLARGFDPRVRDREGQTPLHIALYWGWREAADVLVDADSGNDVKDKDSWTPLHWAACCGWVDIVRKLVAAGARSLLQNNYLRTPLHCALYHGSGAAAQFLAELDEENDLPDDHGDTPLHLAAKSGHAGVVKGLLSSGVCPNEENDRGECPLYLAAGREHDDCVILILAVYAWKGIEVGEGDLFSPEPSSPFRLYWMQRCTDLLSEYEAELRRMKETEVGGSTISYHDVATRHVSDVAMYLRNEAVREELLCGRGASGFPVYGNLIARRVRRAEEKRVLLDECVECLSLLFRKLPPLSSACVEILLRCLTERDMKNIISAVKFC